MSVYDYPPFVLPPEQLDRILGVQSFQDQPVPQVPKLTPLQHALASYSGLENQAPQGRTFLEGLLSGVGSGLGTAGTQIATRQAALQQKANEATAANVKGHQELRAARGKALSELSAKQRQERIAQDKLNTENPVVDDTVLAAYQNVRGLERLKGQRVSRDLLNKLALEQTKPPEATPYKIKGVPATRREYLAYQVATQKTTADQLKAQSFYDRANNAVKGINSIEDRIIKGGNTAEFGLSAPRVAQNSDQKAYNTAVDAFALAVLRRESGATITPSEKAEIRRTYFAAPGDGPVEIANKRALRADVINGFRSQAVGSVTEPAAQPSVADEYQQYLQMTGGQ